jgi:hypothetical protein
MLQSFHAFLKDPSAFKVRPSTDQYKHKRRERRFRKRRCQKSSGGFDGKLFQGE